MLRFFGLVGRFVVIVMVWLPCDAAYYHAMCRAKLWCEIIALLTQTHAGGGDVGGKWEEGIEIWGHVKARLRCFFFLANFCLFVSESFVSFVSFVSFL